MSTIEPKDARMLVAEGKAIVLDVRSPEEYAEGHIAGARNVSINDAGFARTIEMLNRDDAYVVYCMGGGRAGRAVSLMEKLGFKYAKNLAGGITAWKSAHLPVEK